MKKRDMKYYIKIWTLLSIIQFILLSCSDETMVGSGDSGEDIGINIGTRSVLFPDNPDDKISGLRIMAFDTKWHLIQRNRYYSTTELNSNLLFQINNGTYDFVIIANEPRDGVINTSLDQVNSLTDLDNIQLSASAFNDNTDIPMMNSTPNVEVLTDNRGVLISGVNYHTWEITLQRLATRFDLLLYSNTGAASDFTGLTFTNLPNYVPLMGGNYDGTQAVTRTYTVAGNPSYFQPATVSGAAWAIKVSRVILPSNQFSPANQADRAAVLKIQMTGGGLNPQCLLGMNEASNDYTLPHNKNFQITAKVEYPVQVNVGVTDWGLVNLNGTIYNKRHLNVSALTATVTNINMARIYFYSSESNVNVVSTGYVGSTGSTTFHVDDVFKSLSGTSATSLHYSSGTSIGYIDIDLKNPYITSGQTYRIFLDANGLRRELTVTTGSRTSVTWSNIRFAGTFHRWNQVGERPIYGTDDAGNWTATVEYPAGQTNFVVLSSQKSLDPSLGTDNPGDAETFKVINGTSTVSGTGPIYFRVGMSGTLAAATSNPRYARIKVTSSTLGTSYMYVRQGEAADYVMRPQDSGGSGESWGSPNPRPKASKVANFNLTDPQRAIGKVDRGNQGYTFTSYPSQGGYYFQWYGTPAWSPLQSPPPNWNGSSAPGYWSSYPKWETCPPGYHRPDDGSTSGPVDEYLPDVITNSEARQSLWLNPQIGITNNTDNSVYGYYADGFFERHKITGLTSDGNFLPNFYTGSGTEVAFVGTLLYNPATYASIFMPSALSYELDGTKYVGKNGTYWTSSTSGLVNAQFISMHNTVTHFVQPAAAIYGRSVRCVAN